MAAPGQVRKKESNCSPTLFFAKSVDHGCGPLTQAGACSVESLVTDLATFRTQARGIASYPDLLNDCQSPDPNKALQASKSLLAVAEATQVPALLFLLCLKPADFP